jgi:hypothetical protein
VQVIFVAAVLQSWFSNCSVAVRLTSNRSLTPARSIVRWTALTRTGSSPATSSAANTIPDFMLPFAATARSGV